MSATCPWSRSGSLVLYLQQAPHAKLCRYPPARSLGEFRHNLTVPPDKRPRGGKDGRVQRLKAGVISPLKAPPRGEPTPGGPPPVPRPPPTPPAALISGRGTYGRIGQPGAPQWRKWGKDPLGATDGQARRLSHTWVSYSRSATQGTRPPSTLGHRRRPSHNRMSTNYGRHSPSYAVILPGPKPSGVPAQPAWVQCCELCSGPSHVVRHHRGASVGAVRPPVASSHPHRVVPCSDPNDWLWHRLAMSPVHEGKNRDISTLQQYPHIRSVRNGTRSVAHPAPGLGAGPFPPHTAEITGPHVPPGTPEPGVRRAGLPCFRRPLHGEGDAT